MQHFRIRKSLFSRYFQLLQWSSKGMGQLLWLEEITLWKLSEVWQRSYLFVRLDRIATFFIRFFFVSAGEMLWLILKAEILKVSKNSCFQPEAITTRNLLRSVWKIFSSETVLFTRPSLSKWWLQNEHLARVCICALKGSMVSANKHLYTHALNPQAQV